MILIYVPVGTEEHARRLVRTLVEERLVACANLVPVQSVYRWKGRVVEEGETLVLMKTRRELYDRCAARIRELHTYSIPCIAAYPAEQVNAPYLAWVREQTDE